MNSPETLLNLDRCLRNGYWSQKWELPAIHPNEILRRAVDAGLMTEEDDPGQYAGDTVMTLASERTLDVEGSQYACAVHHAALADVIVTAVRGSGPAWARPADKLTRNLSWESACFLEPTGVRLRRILLVDRWSKERFEAETHSWKGLGEVSVYEMPMSMTIVLIGQRREGKHYSPWSKGWLHPKNWTLRIRKYSGEGFGKDWKPCWREQVDQFSRDKWLDQMQADGVMPDVLFEKEIPVPIPEVMAKIRYLAEKKLKALRETKQTPDPNPSVCFWPTPCQFRGACWQFVEASAKTGFVEILPASAPLKTVSTQS